MKPKRLLDKEKLENFYVFGNHTLLETLKEMACGVKCLKENLKWFGLKIRNRSESLIGKKSLNLDVDLLKKYYTEDDLSIYEISLVMECSNGSVENYMKKYNIPRRKSGVSSKDNENWDILSKKIISKQKYITTNRNLSEFGYVTCEFDKKYDKIQWILKTAREEDNVSRLADRRIWQQKWRKTEAGRISTRKGVQTHRKKGFIPLRREIPNSYDWHHIHPELPFVFPVERKLHRKVLGKKHFDFVNEEIGFDVLIGKSKKEIEYFIEINYPDSFKEYCLKK